MTFKQDVRFTMFVKSWNPVNSTLLTGLLGQEITSVNGITRETEANEGSPILPSWEILCIVWVTMIMG